MAQAAYSIGGQRATALLVALFYCIFLVCALNSSTQEPALGMTFAYDDASRLWLVTDVVAFGEASANGVRVGDTLAAIDGLPPDANAPLAIDRANRLTFARPGGGHEFTIERYRQNPDGASPWPFFVIGTLFCLVGVGALAFGRGSAPRALALLCCVGAIMIANLPLGFRGVPWSVVVNAFALPLFVGSFALLFAVFPVERSLPVRSRRIRAYWILPPALLVSCSYLAVPFVPGTIAVQAKDFLLSAYYIGCLLLGMGLLVRSWWQSKNTRGGRQLRILAIGIYLAVRQSLRSRSSLQH